MTSGFVDQKRFLVDRQKRSLVIDRTIWICDQLYVIALLAYHQAARLKRWLCHYLLPFFYGLGFVTDCNVVDAHTLQQGWDEHFGTQSRTHGCVDSIAVMHLHEIGLRNHLVVHDIKHSYAHFDSCYEIYILICNSLVKCY